ncbi:MAG: TspO/MBR family protein [Christensenellaceae bacterium]
MKSKKIAKTWVYIVSIALRLRRGISSVFAMSAMKEYGALRQPPLAPPSWLFPVVWTILFVLMGISAARIYIIGKQDRSGGTVRCGDNSDIGGQAACALRIYLVQLILNMLWTPLFFTLNLRLAAFVLLVMLLITVIVMTCRFFKLDKVSGILMLPYIAWLLFAGYLNLGTYILNG